MLEIFEEKVLLRENVEDVCNDRERLAHYCDFDQCVFISLLKDFKCDLDEQRRGKKRPWLCKSLINFCSIAWFLRTIVLIYVMIIEMLLKGRVVSRDSFDWEECTRFPFSLDSFSEVWLTWVHCWIRRNWCVEIRVLDFCQKTIWKEIVSYLRLKCHQDLARRVLQSVSASQDWCFPYRFDETVLKQQIRLFFDQILEECDEWVTVVRDCFKRNWVSDVVDDLRAFVF